MSLFSVLPLFFFFFNDTATTEISTLSLHDALPICGFAHHDGLDPPVDPDPVVQVRSEEHTSELQSRVDISYAVFCLKKNTIRLTGHLRPTARRPAVPLHQLQHL